MQLDRIKCGCASGQSLLFLLYEEHCIPFGPLSIIHHCHLHIVYPLRMRTVTDSFSDLYSRVSVSVLTPSLPLRI